MIISKTGILKKQIQELEFENSELKVQLMESRAIIESLQQENKSLCKRLSSYKYDGKPNESKAESASSSVRMCDNCNQEVPADNIDLHKVQCYRRIVKCKACNLGIPTNQLENHINTEKGTVEDLIKDIELANIESLGNREAHGCKFDIVLDDPGQNTLIHIATKTGRREVLQFLLNKGINVNSVNSFGETPLHVACGKLKDFAMVQFLVSKGSDLKATNAMGDSAVEVAKRNGFHEAVLYFQQKLMGNARPGSSFQSSRPSTSVNLLNRGL